jgi:ABC-type phosphate/phosphonate transport system substrate-binding protein
MRYYFHDEAHLPVEVVLFLSYEAQVSALLSRPGDAAPRIDIAWNTNLAYLQADEWSGHTCRPVAMRDTDLGWMTKIVTATGGSISSLVDLRDRTLALAAATVATPPFCLSTFCSNKECGRAKSIEVCDLTAMWANMVTQGPAKLK